MPDLRELFDALAAGEEARGVDEVWQRATRRTRRRWWLVAAAVVLAAGIGTSAALMAGDEGKAPVELVDDPSETSPEATEAPPATAADTGTLLVWPPERASSGTEMAIVRGIVTFDAQGCVRLDEDLVIWPVGTGWSIEGSAIRLPSGATVRAGDVVTGAGGYHARGPGLPAAIPARCEPDQVAVFGSTVEIAVTRADGTVDFTRGYGMAVSPEGLVAVSDRSSRKVWQRDANGVWVSLPVAGRGFLADPRGIAYDGAGNLYVADESAGRVQVISLEGAARVVAEGLDGPTSVAFDARDGTVLVAEGGADRIRRIDATGNLTTVEESHDNLCGPISIAIASDGAIWFGELCDKDVRRIDPDGSIATVEGVSFGSSLASARDGGMYVANGRSGEIWHVALDGTVTTVLTWDRANVTQNDCADRGYSGTSEAIAMAETDDGLVFVDSGSGRLCVLAGETIREL